MVIAIKNVRNSKLRIMILKITLIHLIIFLAVSVINI